jgi:hypothetical protein
VRGYAEPTDPSNEARPPVGSIDGAPSAPVHPALEHRVRTLLEVARVHRVPLAFDHLLAMLPAGEEWSEADLQRCLDTHPSWGSVVDGYVHATNPASTHDLTSRRRRSAALVQEAVRAVNRDLGVAVELTRCIGISGSVAFGLAEPEDDLDFFVVVRDGGAWLFLLLALLRSRRLHRDGTAAAPWCFNYVVEEGAVESDFTPPQGLLVAREALSVRVLRGEGYYRSVLLRSPWMGAELPKMYAERTAELTPDRAPRPLGWATRIVNALAYPVLATYLQVVGLVGNRRLRRFAPSTCFATETGFRRFQLRTAQFDRLRRIYRAASSAPSDPRAG